MTTWRSSSPILCVCRQSAIKSFTRRITEVNKWKKKHFLCLFDLMTSLSTALSFVLFPLSTRGSERRGLNRGQHSHYFWLRCFWLGKNRHDREAFAVGTRAHKSGDRERQREVRSPMKKEDLTHSNITTLNKISERYHRGTWFRLIKYIQFTVLFWL